MKIRSSSQFRKRGVALVIVLSVLVLMSALVIGFMSSVTTERKSTQANAGVIGARHLSDTALNLVIAQIREATNGLNPQTKSPDEKLTWASQPGLLRTISGKVGARKSLSGGAYDQIYTPGSGDFVYKLYSAENMTVPSAKYDGADRSDLKAETAFIEKYDPNNLDVDKNPELADWVDLNEPFFVPPLSADATLGENIVEPRYPIMDPRAKANYATGSFVTNPTYGSVDGFDCKKFEHPELKYMARLINGSYQEKPVPLLPMPVRWLYQLKDGTIVPSIQGRVKGATKSNPIVGRVAFWSDDETCKLNINTASEGTFWGTPTASSKEESGEVTSAGAMVTNPQNSANLSASQPVRGEYQRYPGHPATTSLSPALGWLYGLDPNIPTYSKPIPAEFKEAMAELTPFMPIANPRPQSTLGSSTSLGGWQNPDPFTPAVLKPGEFPILNQPTRYLRATVDELLFNADRFPRNQNLVQGQDNPRASLIGNGKITPEALERVRAFLTTTSRAPDLNAYSRPRVTFWPVSAETKFRTSYDELFAFTSTINAKPPKSKAGTAPIPFYFTRFDANCNENDLFVDVVRPSGRTPQLQPDLRGKQNLRMLEYLKFLTGGSDAGGGGLTDIPGFGGSLRAKYAQGRAGAPGVPERTQILTEILDYMRTVNISDSGEGKQSGVYRPYTPRFYKNRNTDGYTRIERSNDGSGQVTPLVTKNAAGQVLTQGMGRFLTMSDAAMMFYKTQTTAKPAANGQPAVAAKDAIQAALILQMSTTMPNYPAIRDTFFTKVRELPAKRNRVKIGNDVNFQDLGFSTSPLININNVSAHEVGFGRGFMPTLGFLGQMHYFPPHSAPTTVNNGAGRNNSFTVTKKTFSNDLTLYPEIGNYVRGKTERIYPYISNALPIVIGNGPQVHSTFDWQGGSFEVEIWAGEAPDDPSARKVQTITFGFPQQTLKFSMVTGTTLESRLTGSLDAMAAITSNDPIRGIEYVGSTAAGTPLPLRQQGDLRIAASSPVLVEGDYAPREAGLPNGGRYFETNAATGIAARLSLHSLRVSHGSGMSGFSGSNLGVYAPGQVVTDPARKQPILPAGVQGVLMESGTLGDFDRGLSKHMSGAFGNKVDEGNIYFGYTDSPSGMLPYFRGRAIEETGQSFFSPNRQLPSAVMFGSLPTGVLRKKPWQTLLFHPNRGAGNHPGADQGAQPADYHLLDLLHLPVIEPYAISEPFSTAGKVNLNYVMAPFGYAKGDSGSNPKSTELRSYIRRDTAVRGVLKGVKIMAVPTTMPYGGHAESPLNISQQTRYDIDLDQTLATLENRIKDPQRGAYRSTAEICNVDLIPQQLGKPGNWATFWEQQFGLTGDNMRELPYAHIYPRITTKSNVFMVHMRCQSIRKAPNTDPEQFEEGRDAIIGEYRGSSVIERFIDPNDPALADYDYTKTNGAGRLDLYYRFRILNSKQFTAH